MGSGGEMPKCLAIFIEHLLYFLRLSIFGRWKRYDTILHLFMYDFDGFCVSKGKVGATGVRAQI